MLDTRNNPYHSDEENLDNLIISMVLAVAGIAMIVIGIVYTLMY